MSEVECKKLMAVAHDVCNQWSDPKAARKALRTLLDKDDKLRGEVLDELIDLAIGRCVYLARHSDLRRLQGENTGLRPRGSDAAVCTAGTMTRALLDSWVLENGQRLGDATGAYLTELADTYKAQAGGLLVKASFYVALARKAPGETVLRTRWKESAVSRLWRSVSKAMDQAA